MHAAIIDRGRGPEIAGTPITVYDIWDYRKERAPSHGHRIDFADFFGSGASRQYQLRGQPQSSWCISDRPGISLVALNVNATGEKQ